MSSPGDNSGDTAYQVVSFREHYFARRGRFYSILLASAVVTGCSPWIFAFHPWPDIGPMHLVGAALACLAMTGLAVKSPVVHAALAVAAILISVAAFIFAPPMAPVG